MCLGAELYVYTSHLLELDKRRPMGDQIVLPALPEWNQIVCPSRHSHQGLPPARPAMGLPSVFSVWEVCVCVLVPQLTCNLQ